LYHDAPLAPGVAAAVVAVGVATIYAVQLVGHAIGAPALVTSSLVDTAVIVGVIAYARGRGISLAQLGLRRPRARYLAGAALLGIGVWYLTALLVVVIQPPGDTAELEQLVEQTPLVPTLAALALFPPAAEELLFRGVLVRSLAPRLGAPLAVVVGAAVFGVYHLFPPQMVSTFALGLVLGFVTLRSRSIVPAMITHALNNTVAVVLTRDTLSGLGLWIDAHPAAMLIAAIAVVGCGIGLAAKGPA
jgi:membrane protease YdiL (CAAX protease family)